MLEEVSIMLPEANKLQDTSMDFLCPSGIKSIAHNVFGPGSLLRLVKIRESRPHELLIVLALSHVGALRLSAD